MRYLLRSISDLRNGQGRGEIARFALGASNNVRDD